MDVVHEMKDIWRMPDYDIDNIEKLMDLVPILNWDDKHCLCRDIE